VKVDSPPWTHACLSARKLSASFMWITLFSGPKTRVITDLAMMLRGKGVDLEQEDDAAGFLGVTLDVIRTLLYSR